MKYYPKISIITVNYNKGQYIEETILSVINQNYPNLEYIIIDGGSKDNSLNIITKYQKHLAYWVSEPDEGMTHALQKGFNQATGEILAWINSDDTYLPNTFNLVAKAFVATRCDFLYGDLLLTDQNNQYIKKVPALTFSYRAYCHGIFIIPQPASFWTKQLYNQVGGINREFQVAMDMDLFSRFLSSHDTRIKRLKIPLANFRLHDQQSASWAPEGRYQQELAIIKERCNVSNYNFLVTLSYKIIARIIWLLKTKE